jgi:hypothetical protein
VTASLHFAILQSGKLENFKNSSGGAIANSPALQRREKRKTDKVP